MKSELFGSGERPATVPHAVRSQGVLDLRFSRRGEGTALMERYQAGCLRVRVPRPERADERPCAVLINTSGGLAEGDRIAQTLRWDARTAATATSQAAEKVYRAQADGCRLATRIEVGAGAEAEWLPQESILFDDASLVRDTQVLLAPDASFLGLEAIVLGRTAMGETVTRGRLHDRLRVWRGDRLVYADAVDLGGDVAALTATPAITNGAAAMAMILHVSARASAYLEPLREALGGARGRAAASAWNGMLAVRLLAPDGEALRHDIVAALAVLRDRRGMPRVWRC